VEVARIPLSRSDQTPLWQDFLPVIIIVFFPYFKSNSGPPENRQARPRMSMGVPVLFYCLAALDSFFALDYFEYPSRRRQGDIQS
jgi:hypothetical protein